MGRSRRPRPRLPVPSRPGPIGRAWRRIRRRPVLTGPSYYDNPDDTGFGPPDAGVREPRHPRPTAGAGAMALPLPNGD